MKFQKTVEFDEVKAMELYMDGMFDTEIAQILGVDDQYVCDWRNKNELPSNVGVFSWQKKLRKSELKKIPPKYLNPRLGRAANG